MNWARRALMWIYGYGHPHPYDPVPAPVQLVQSEPPWNLRTRAKWIFDGCKWVHDYNYPGSGEWVYQWHLKDRPGVIWQWARWDYTRKTLEGGMK